MSSELIRALFHIFSLIFSTAVFKKSYFAIFFPISMSIFLFGKIILPTPMDLDKVLGFLFIFYIILNLKSIIKDDALRRGLFLLFFIGVFMLSYAVLSNLFIPAPINPAMLGISFQQRPPFRSIFAAGYRVMGVASFMMPALCVHSPDDVRRIIRTQLLVVEITCLLGILQWVGYNFSPLLYYLLKPLAYMDSHGYVPGSGGIYRISSIGGEPKYLGASILVGLSMVLIGRMTGLENEFRPLMSNFSLGILIFSSITTYSFTIVSSSFFLSFFMIILTKTHLFRQAVSATANIPDWAWYRTSQAARRLFRQMHSPEFAPKGTAALPLLLVLPLLCVMVFPAPFSRIITYADNLGFSSLGQQGIKAVLSSQESSGNVYLRHLVRKPLSGILGYGPGNAAFHFETADFGSFGSEYYASSTAGILTDLLEIGAVGLLMVLFTGRVVWVTSNRRLLSARTGIQRYVLVCQAAVFAALSVYLLIVGYDAYIWFYLGLIFVIGERLAGPLPFVSVKPIVDEG